MNLKIGQLGVIIKPTSCCNNTTVLGKIVSYQGKIQTSFSECIYCNRIKSMSNKVKIGGIYSPRHQDVVISPYRVKWFNDELDKELEVESNEDLVMEKETT